MLFQYIFLFRIVKIAEYIRNENYLWHASRSLAVGVKVRLRTHCVRDYGGQPSLYALLRAKAGGAYRIRTDDPHTASVML